MTYVPIPILCTRQTGLLPDQAIAAHIAIAIDLDDQTQVDSKPAGQPEHASLNQSQIIAANRPKLMLWAPPASGGDKVSL